MKSFFVQFNHRPRGPKPKYFGSTGTTVIGVNAETPNDAMSITRARFPDKVICFTRVSPFQSQSPCPSQPSPSL